MTKFPSTFLKGLVKGILYSLWMNADPSFCHSPDRLPTWHFPPARGYRDKHLDFMIWRNRPHRLRSLYLSRFRLKRLRCLPERKSVSLDEALNGRPTRVSEKAETTSLMPSTWDASRKLHSERPGSRKYQYNAD